VAAALTAPYWEDRVLGKSEMVRFPIRCVWIATGNNPQFSNEIARRMVRIRHTKSCWRRCTSSIPNIAGPMNWLDWEDNRTHKFARLRDRSGTTFSPCLAAYQPAWPGSIPPLKLSRDAPVARATILEVERND
jgi:hypothetical protein